MVTVVLVFLAGCASHPRETLTESEILKIAQSASYNYCHTGSSAGYQKVGCELSALFTDNTWSVIAHSVYRNDKGETLQVMGSDMLYVFSPSGKLLSTHPGM